MSIPTWLSEPRILGALVVFGLVLRVAMAWRFRVDSDEPQHLHVLWARTRGLLPYRDVFDNHMPLFHLLTAPMLLTIGERPTATLWMRLLMLPQWGAALAGNVENLPIQTRRWVRAHYLRVMRYPGVGGVLIAGARFDEARGGFEVGIPALYAVVEPSGAPHGLLDGQPYAGLRHLRPGFHSYQPAPGESHVALLWSTADKRAFSPYEAEGKWR